jgi:hypothetical protein
MQHLQRSGDNLRRGTEPSVPHQFLEQGLHAMQRRSGGLSLVPDVFVITSLDVIIHTTKKLGDGGFSKVFEGQWQGSSVAVKVLDSGVPSAVSQLLSYNMIDCLNWVFIF